LQLLPPPLLLPLLPPLLPPLLLLLVPPTPVPHFPLVQLSEQHWANPEQDVPSGSHADVPHLPLAHSLLQQSAFAEHA